MNYPFLTYFSQSQPVRSNAILSLHASLILSTMAIGLGALSWLWGAVARHFDVALLSPGKGVAVDSRAFSMLPYGEAHTIMCILMNYVWLPTTIGECTMDAGKLHDYSGYVIQIPRWFTCQMTSSCRTGVIFAWEKKWCLFLYPLYVSSRQVYILLSSPYSWYGRFWLYFSSPIMRPGIPRRRASETEVQHCRMSPPTAWISCLVPGVHGSGAIALSVSEPSLQTTHIYFLPHPTTTRHPIEYSTLSQNVFLFLKEKSSWNIQHDEVFEHRAHLWS